MDQRAEDERVIKYCERELRKLKQDKGDPDDVARVTREKLLRAVVKDRVRRMQKVN